MGLQPKQTQHQRLMLAPNVTLALEILRMPTMELRAFLEHQLEENPLLELDETDDEGAISQPESPTTTSETSEGTPLDEEWLSHWRTSGEQESPDSENAWEERLIDQRLVRAQSMQESLQMQLGCQNLSAEEQRLGHVLLEHLDENGYLEDSLEELAKEVRATLPELERALKHIQRLDPPGVGARNLRECLMLQMESAGACDSLAYRILQDHFELFVHHRMQAIAHATQASLEEVRQACEHLTNLNPKPGRSFSGDLPPSVIPDLIIHRRERHYDVELNDQDIPHVTVNRFYYRMLKNPSTPSEAKTFLTGKLRNANWLIKAIEERNATLVSIARCLISLQRDFLERGPKALKPLTQSQVAASIGRHPSTVSRAIAGKTIDTPYGVFRLEQWFASNVPQSNASEQSEGISDETIKSEIQRLIVEEDPQHPLSDARLVQRLAQRHIVVARRTIAKYRASLKLLPAHYRKRRLS